ncbi:ABC transporter permease [Chryseolinea lacunae]|uniref:Transport permease protein n=1 Tax=Chryseolinea lacunae TaxID=2801331 RepID=A0ABS1KMU2_9BACT|nr:ABC transporter permease [Chryseolinea lacunae]MBL0739987.1 ABC transporter permease [Chryseolinea lacunae]
MKEIITLTRKDLQLLFLDKTSLIVTFALPVMLVALIGTVFSRSFPSSTGITSYDYAFSKVMFWGLIGGVASSVASLAIEKNSGTIIRIQLAPVHKVHVLAGKALACVCVILISSLVTWVFASVLFGIKTASHVNLLLICFSNAVFFAGLMTFLANFVHTERAAGALSWSVLQLLACFSGIMFPITLMPPWMSNASNFNPVTWAVKAMETVLWRGGTFSELWLPVAITVGGGVFFFALSAYLFRWTTQNA